MEMQIKSVSSLEKVFCKPELDAQEITKISGLRGETVSFQIAVKAPVRAKATCIPGNPESFAIKIRETGLVPCTIPAVRQDPFTITTLPGLFPDPLLPINEKLDLSPDNWHAFWITIEIPKNAKAGTFKLKFETEIANYYNAKENLNKEVVLELEVIPEELPKQVLKNINWFYADCIMTYYKVPCWSERHWELLEQYFKSMAKHGVNTVLTPLWTVSLDTALGKERPTVQLLKISLKDGKYEFDFSRLERWIALAKKSGVEYFEMSHAFTQWGAKCTPKIIVEVNGTEEKRFGWHVPANSPEYAKFLKELMAKLIPFLKKEQELDGKCYFHVSDEPCLEDIDSYQSAMNLLKGLVGGFPILDALSRIEFFNRGITEYPVAGTTDIEDFMKIQPKERWVYYAGFWENGLPNRQYGMPSIRNRIMGTLLFLYNMDGFLHWGYNFWYTAHSEKQDINPYLETDAGRKFCGGASYLVYPGENGPVDSLRYEVFNEGLQDLRAMKALEKKIGRDAVTALIHEGLSYQISMTHYPHEAEWLLEMRERINSALKLGNGK